MPDRGSDHIDELGATVALSDVRPSGAAAAGTSSDLALDATMSLSDSVGGPPMSSEFVLRPFGPYTEVELLDQQGAMGIVAKGFNEAFRRWELLKFLRTDQSDADLRERQFLREGRVLARLSHPNVVQVFAIHQVDGRPCLAMEYLHGGSLTAYVAEQGERMPVARWYELFLDAARGLAAAHQVGLLHRDLKPDNLFVVRDDKGRAGGLKLIDFGLASAVHARREGDGRDSGLVADLSGGTPVYMAPELWGNSEGTPTSDVFGLAMSFYYAATGRLPFEVTILAHVIRQVTSPEPFASVRQYRPDLPAPLADVLAKALSKRPDERYSNAEDLLAALVAARDASRPRRVPGSGPYRGLAPYTTEERDVFFGRDVETAEVLERLRTRAGVVVVGPDGAGKTSLLQASVVPAVEAGALGFGIDYRTVRVEPAQRPLAALAAATASATGNPEKQILAFLQRTPDRLAEALRESADDQRGFIVVADPLEALLGDDVDYAESIAFCRAIASIMQVPRPELRLIATVRPDRIDRLFSLEPLRPLLNHGIYPLRPLAGAELRSALEEPAHTAGFEFESTAILDEVVQDTARTAAGLPLASFAMSAWWLLRDQERHLLPDAAWRELGGLRGALVRHAESVVSSMGRDHRAATEVLLGRLVSADGDRLRVNRSDLEDPAVAGPDAPHVLEILLQSRVVQESFGSIELAHDALVSSWPRVQAMLASSGEDWAFRERVAAAAHAWDTQGRPDGALWTADQATRLLMWLSSSKATLTQTELAFAETIRKRRSVRKLLLRSGIVAATTVLVAFGVAAKSNEYSLRRQLAETVEQRNQSHTAFLQAEAARLRLEAQAALPDDPRGALDAALASYELKADTALDNLSWRARALGIPTLLPPLPAAPASVRFAPNGKWLALADANGAVNVLASIDSAHGAARIGDGPVVALAFSPEGQSLAVGGKSGLIAVGTAPSFDLSRKVSCPAGVIDLVWTDETTLLANCSPPEQSETVFRIDTAAMTLTKLVEGRFASKLRPGGFVMLAGANALVTYARGALSPALPVEIGPGKITTLATGAEPTDVVVGLDDGMVMRAPGPASSDKPAAALARHESAVTSVGLSPDGESVVSFSDTRKALLTLLRSGKTVEWATSRELVSWIPLRHAVVFAGTDNEAIVVSTQTGEELARLRGARRPLTAMATDPAARWLVAASYDGASRAYALEEALTTVARPALAVAPLKCAMSPDAAWAGCVDREGATAEQILREGRDAAPPRRMEGTRAGVVQAAHVTAGGKQLLWSIGSDLFDDGRKAVLPGPALAFASSARADTLVAIGTQPSPWIRSLPGNGGPAKVEGRPGSAAVSPDGSTIVTGYEDGSLGLWGKDISAGGAVRLEGASHAGAVTAVAVSDDGEFIAAATARGYIALGARDKESIAVVYHADEPVVCLAFARSSALVWYVTRTGKTGFADASGHGWVATGAMSSPPAGCARSPLDDRFVWIAEDGSVRVRWFDLGPLAGARRPEPEARGRKGPPIESWRGLPTERTW